MQKIENQKRSNSRGIISVIIPSLNEENGIDKTINEIPKEELKKMGYSCEILVVDGGSKDNTRENARNSGARVIVEFRPGYGIAYKTGFAHARGNIIVALDGDFSYPAFLIPRLVELLEEQKLDFISTNRMSDFTNGSFSLFHLLGNKVLTYLVNFLFKVDIQDSQSGMWVFRKSVLGRVNLLANGMPFSEEIKILAFKLLKSKEISIPYRKRTGEKKLHTLIDGAKNLAYLFNLRFSLTNVARKLNLSEQPF